MILDYGVPTPSIRFPFSSTRNRSRFASLVRAKAGNDYYSTLNLSNNASLQQIKSSSPLHKDNPTVILNGLEMMKINNSIGSLSAHVTSGVGGITSDSSSNKVPVIAIVMLTDWNLNRAIVEIREEVGADNFFLFGAKAHEIAGLREERPEGKFQILNIYSKKLKIIFLTRVLNSLPCLRKSGFFPIETYYNPADYFVFGMDFPSYLQWQEEVDEAYREQKLKLGRRATVTVLAAATVSLALPPQQYH
ncbi:glycogen phosphorylase [Trifolium repens]|nr:glycogen phosphorylase [Trifolium repens]